MAALNEAWRVLGDRDRRRDYDRALGDALSVPRPVAPGGAAPTAAREPRYNPLARYQNPPRVPWGPMAVIAGIGAVAVVLASAVSPGTPVRPADSLLQPEDCVSIDATGAASESLCDGSHDGVVESIVTDPLQCPQHTEAHRAVVGDAVVCVRV